MGISIKHDEIERAIRDLASARNLSLTDAIGLAVRNELARHGAVAPDRAGLVERIRVIQDRVARFHVLDPRPATDLLYDEHGLPR